MNKINTSDKNSNIVRVVNNDVKYYQDLAEKSALSAENNANLSSDNLAAAQRILSECERIYNNINNVYIPSIDTHVRNVLNPHSVTAEQVFTYDKNEIDILIEEVISSRKNDSQLANLILEIVSENITELDDNVTPDNPTSDIQEVTYDNENAEPNSSGQVGIYYRDSQIIFTKEFLSKVFGGQVEDNLEYNVISDSRLSVKVALSEDKTVSYPIFLKQKSSIIALGNHSDVSERGLSDEYHKIKVFSYDYNEQTQKISNVKIYYPNNWIAQENVSDELLLTEDNYKISRLYKWFASDDSFIYGTYGSSNNNNSIVNYVRMSKFWDENGIGLDTSDLVINSSCLPNVGVVINNKTYWLMDEDYMYYYIPSDPYPKQYLVDDGSDFDSDFDFSDDGW